MTGCVLLVMSSCHWQVMMYWFMSRCHNKDISNNVIFALKMLLMSEWHLMKVHVMSWLWRCHVSLMHTPSSKVLPYFFYFYSARTHSIDQKCIYNVVTYISESWKQNVSQFPHKYEAELFSTLTLEQMSIFRVISEGSCDTEDWSNDMIN